MSKPDRVSPADLDEAVKEGIERAEQTNELSQGDLDHAAGGISPVIRPGMITPLPIGGDAM